MGVCLMIIIMTQFQTSPDNFQPNKDCIYNVLTENHTQMQQKKDDKNFKMLISDILNLLRKLEC